MSESCIFSFYSRHMNFANNVVSIGNKHGVNLPSISQIKIAFLFAGNGARVRIFAFSIPTEIGLYRVSSLPMQDYQ